MILRIVYTVMAVTIIALVCYCLHYTDEIKDLKLKNSSLEYKNMILKKDLQENIEILERIKEHMKF